MSNADDLMQEAHRLAARMQRLRAGNPPEPGHKTDTVSGLESRLAGLWTEIRAARAAAPPRDSTRNTDYRSRSK